MAQRPVVETTCDKCGKTEYTDHNDRRAQLQLPDQWTHVTMASKTADLVSVDLCAEHSAALLPALGVNIKGPKGNPGK